MPTLNEMISDIRELASSGKENYSIRIEDSLIGYWVCQTRAKMISDAITKRESITDQWVQPLSCLKMILVDKSECCFITTNCYVLRSEKKLPSTVEYFNDNGIIKIVTADGTVINKSNNFKVNFTSYNKYTKDKDFWYISNGYLYVINELLIDYVTVYGIWENPMDLVNFVSCSGDTCFSIDDPFPCSYKMANDITNYVVRSKVLPFYSTIPDKSNDADSEDGLKNPNGLVQR